jgi:molybdate transport system substrate-binding protein
LGLRKGAPDDARELRDFLLSDQGQAILKEAGFSRVG